MTRSFLLFLFHFSLCVALSQDVPTGRIAGRVTELSNRRPIAGANVVVQRSSFGASTTTDGRFLIDRIPAGSYTLKVSCVGYRAAFVTDVVVGSGRTTQADVQLDEESVQLGGEVVVTGSLFAQPKEVTTSAYRLNNEEIRRAPGALGDVHRMIQSMPGVVPTNDQRNDLVVRGGSPSENLTVVDNVDVPNLSHFGTQGASGGPISMLNTEFIREANFLAGGFPAQYGTKLSSVLNVLLRDGSRDGFTGEVDLSVAGAGGVLEGPMGKDGAWMFAARRSFLELLIGKYGMTAVPTYTNYQLKMSTEPDASNRLWLVSIGGIDRITFTYDPNEIEDPSSLNVESGGWRSITGINWQTVWGKRGYGILAMSDALDVFEQNARNVRLQNREVFRNRSREGVTTLKYDAVLTLEGLGQLTAGVTARRVRATCDIAQPLGMPNMWSTDSTRVDTLMIERNTVVVQGSMYAQCTATLADRWTLTAGIRYDHFGYAEDAWALAPRVGLSFSVTPSFVLNGSWGMFYQSPPEVFINAVSGNDRLKPLRADHYVGGAVWYPTADLKVSVEGYYKKYAKYPVSAQHPTFSLANAGDAYSIAGFLFPMVSGGTGESKGIELYVQKKLTDQFYGQISYSFSQAQHMAFDRVLRPGSFDIPHVLSLVGGFRVSDQWEVSAKFTYASGRPTTPLREGPSYLQNRQILDVARVNEGRMPDYHRLDIRADYRAQFSGWNLVAYCELQNVYNRKNIFQHVWNEKTRSMSVVKQIAFFPVGGLKVEF